MTLTEETCAVSAKNLAVGMEIFYAGHWFTVSAIEFPKGKSIRMEIAVDSDLSIESLFMTLDGLAQVKSASQIPA